MKACCLCGSTADVVRYRHAEIKGGPAQWVCRDARHCMGPTPGSDAD